ncbi:PHP domain protein [Denitrovibrio acetiphilus DSM 12809]|jgi:histidinol phosphatase-like PHP family hydrolase|uniref:PHP domain protein n=1 Tax=Denitrovibrio acetiphilus (strain DSM 12809 / NBRC 114555 / N2460) TaxID=522772 RepID=D4H7W1_DENA2|nr:histidinol phosphate phosphatase domain-containing protein [Denitrovibrio acetiphilus]ADD68110.1 PHP domain protein [Denitrovibrio acetiphilus DSM 12809]
MIKMYDLHTHTTFSDGVLIPSESARRAEIDGYAGMAFTDHADESNYMHILENQLRFKEEFNAQSEVFKVLVGLELTHVRPAQIPNLTEKARSAGADIIVVHGETITEPVAEGTNDAAVEAGVDILAHPGLISDDTIRKGIAKNVYFEISTRKGHSITNGHVAKRVLELGGELVINNDYHAPGDRVSVEMAQKILAGAGLSNDEINQVFENNRKIFFKSLEA